MQMHVIFLYTWDKCLLNDRDLRLRLSLSKFLLAKAAIQEKKML